MNVTIRKSKMLAVVSTLLLSMVGASLFAVQPAVAYVYTNCNNDPYLTSYPFGGGDWDWSEIGDAETEYFLSQPSHDSTYGYNTAYLEMEDGASDYVVESEFIQGYYPYNGGYTYFGTPFDTVPLTWCSGGGGANQVTVYVTQRSDAESPIYYADGDHYSFVEIMLKHPDGLPDLGVEWLRIRYTDTGGYAFGVSHYYAGDAYCIDHHGMLGDDYGYSYTDDIDWYSDLMWQLLMPIGLSTSEVDHVIEDTGVVGIGHGVRMQSYGRYIPAGAEWIQGTFDTVALVRRELI